MLPREIFEVIRPGIDRYHDLFERVINDETSNDEEIIFKV